MAILNSWETHSVAQMTVLGVQYNIFFLIFFVNKAIFKIFFIFTFSFKISSIALERLHNYFIFKVTLTNFTHIFLLIFCFSLVLFSLCLIFLFLFNCLFVVSLFCVVYFFCITVLRNIFYDLAFLSPHIQVIISGHVILLWQNWGI